MRGNVACDKRVAVLRGIAPPVLFNEESLRKKSHETIRGTFYNEKIANTIFQSWL